MHHKLYEWHLTLKLDQLSEHLLWQLHANKYCDQHISTQIAHFKASNHLTMKAIPKE